MPLFNLSCCLMAKILFTIPSCSSRGLVVHPYPLTRESEWSLSIANYFALLARTETGKQFSIALLNVQVVLVIAAYLQHPGGNSETFVKLRTDRRRQRMIVQIIATAKATLSAIIPIRIKETAILFPANINCSSTAKNLNFLEFRNSVVPKYDSTIRTKRNVQAFNKSKALFRLNKYGGGRPLDDAYGIDPAAKFHVLFHNNFL